MKNEEENGEESNITLSEKCFVIKAMLPRNHTITHTKPVDDSDGANSFPNRADSAIYIG